MNNLNLSEAKKNALLKMAGNKLGTSPDALRQQLENGNLENVVNGLDDKTKAQLSGLLQNPQALNSLLGSDQVQALLKNLSGK